MQQPRTPLRTWLALCLALLVLDVRAQQVLRLNVAPGGFPPYTVVKPGKPAAGIMVDVLHIVARKHGVQIQTLEIPRKRVERMVLQGDIDASPRAQEWTESPEDYLFTDPVLRVRDVVFSGAKSPLVYGKPSDLEGKRVGIRLGYTFPLLTPLFDNGSIKRVETTDERAVLAMLNFQRLDAAVLNEMTALWIIRNENWRDLFVYSRQEVQGYNYRFMFNKKWAAFVTQFNTELAVMKKDGRLAQIVNAYLPNHAIAQN